MLEYLGEPIPLSLPYSFRIEDGNLYAKGISSFGELGMGTGFRTANDWVLVPLPFSTTNIVSITGTTSCTMIITKEGELWKTGYGCGVANGTFQLLLTDCREVKFHDAFVYIVTSKGEVYQWRRDEDRYTILSLPAKVISMSIGEDDEVFAITTAGTVLTWRRGSYTNSKPISYSIPGIVKKIGANHAYVAAVNCDEEIYTWKKKYKEVVVFRRMDA